MSDLLERLEGELTRKERDRSHLDPEEQFRFLAAKSKQILPEDVVLARLRESRKTGKPLVVKLGVDPTSPHLHLGHAVPLFLLRRFQDLGHHVILLVGDFTARIGDPAGRIAERPPLTETQIEENFATYRQQAGKILDMERVEIRHNSEWLEGIQLAGLLATLKGINVSASLQREDFRERIEKGHSLTLAEVLYSVLMGLDSVALDPDIEIGGVDQLLNLQMCRQVMEIEGMDPEGIVVTDILEGVSGDGSKMSKSLGNAVALEDPPEEIYGKVMSIPDRLLESYFMLLTEIRSADWAELAAGMEKGALNPRDVKACLARIVVTLLHDAGAARAAEAHFEEIFRRRRFPDDMPSIRVGRSEWKDLSLVDVLERAGVIASRSEGRRLFAQGAVRWLPEGAAEGDFVKLETEGLPAPAGKGILKVGKRKFVRVLPEGDA
jgi:tyrosyl-tRNA synthetase